MDTLHTFRVRLKTHYYNFCYPLYFVIMDTKFVFTYLLTYLLTYILNLSLSLSLFLLDQNRKTGTTIALIDENRGIKTTNYSWSFVSLYLRVQPNK